MKSTQTTCLLIGLLASLLLGCTGKQGEVGPKGADGINGTNGKDGNPAVIYSNWISAPASSSNWKKLATNLWTYSITSPYFTKDNYNKADVVVYYRSSSTAAGLKLPGSYISTDNTVINWSVLLYESSLAVWQGASIPLTQPWDSEFRWVLIPGGTPTGGRKAAIDLSDYEAVKKAYNLPD